MPFDHTAVIILMLGSIAFSVFGFKLQRLRLPEHPPASRSHLSLEQRQLRIKMASWICIACGLLGLVGAVYLLMHPVTDS
jgi:hypothetical protein